MDFELVTKIACRLQAISNFAYDIHYNARGKDFYENHLFAERIGDQYATASFKDEIFETCFLGRGQDVPSSKEIEDGVLVLTPESSKNEEQDYKKLRGMISACLVDIESLTGLSLGEGDLFGRIASILQRHNGLLFARLSYSENEVVENSENEDEMWKYLMNAKEDIEEWITVKGNHIPVMKGQTKEEATKEFISKKKLKDKKEIKKTKFAEKMEKLSEKAGISKNIQEAREIARQISEFPPIIDASSKIENINIMNKKAVEFLSRYNQKEGLSVYGTSDVMSKTTFMHSHGKLLEMNVLFAQSSKEEQKQNFDNLVTNRNELLKRKLEKLHNKMEKASDMYKKEEISTEIDGVEKALKFKRWSAHKNPDKFLEESVIHEFGHILMDRANDKSKNVDSLVEKIYNKAQKEDIYEVSEYASQDKYEFFAEVYLMKETGQKLPDYIINMIEEIEEIVKE